MNKKDSPREFYVDRIYSKDEINIVALDGIPFPKNLDNVVILIHFSCDNFERRFEIPEGRIGSPNIYGFNVEEKYSLNHYDPNPISQRKRIYLFVYTFDDSSKSVNIKLENFSLEDIISIKAFEVKSDE